MSRRVSWVGLFLALLVWSQAAQAGGIRTILTSGAVDPVSGKPIAAFGRAVINDSGEVAFEGNLEWELFSSVPGAVDYDNDGCLWSTVGGLHRVAREGHVIAGGLYWSRLRNMDLLDSGELIGNCIQKHYGTPPGHPAIWSSRGGPAEVLVEHYAGVSGAQGFIDGDTLGAEIVGGDGTYYFAARRIDLSGDPYTLFPEPFIATESSRRIYEGPGLPEEYFVQGQAHSPLPARVLPGGVVEHTAVRVVYEDSEQYPGGPTMSERQGLRVSVWHTDQVGPSMLRELPMEAPGVGPNMAFDNIVAIEVNDQGRLVMDAYAEKPDGTGMVNGVWAETPDGLELVHANTPENMVAYGWVLVRDVVLSDNGVWAYKAGRGIEKQLLLNVGEGVKSVVMREGSSANGLPNGVTIDRILNYAMSASGELVVLARHSGREDDGGGGLFEDNTPLPFDDPTAGLWVSNEYGLLEPLLLEGMALNVGGELKTIHGVHEASWLDINASGEMPVSVQFVDGSTGLFVATVPEPTTMAILALGGLLALRRRKR